MSGLAGFITALERREAEKAAREEERRAYRRALYRWEKEREASRASGAGLTDAPPPLSPAAARKEAERVAEEAERQRWQALVEEIKAGRRGG